MNRRVPALNRLRLDTTVQVNAFPWMVYWFMDITGTKIKGHTNRGLNIHN